MDKKARDEKIRNGLETFLTQPDFVTNYSWVLIQPQIRQSLYTDQEILKSLEKNKESLIFAYLIANLNFKNTPLKEFLNSFEKKVLLACLHLTRGNQKKTASILSLKPTALIEKMHKHGINGRRKKLSEIHEATRPQETVID